jgi:hypothetical protein
MENGDDSSIIISYRDAFFVYTLLLKTYLPHFLVQAYLYEPGNGVSVDENSGDEDFMPVEMELEGNMGIYS